MTRRTFASLIILVALAAAACGKASGGNTDYPGTEEGAKKLLTDIRTAKDPRAMTLTLKPSSADYKTVYTDDFAAKAEPGYEKLWSDPRAIIGADPANSELLLFHATTEDIKAQNDNGKEFPGGYKRVVDNFKPGITWYRWKYAKPGETLGMAYDGLTYVNGHWVWFPKPWRVAGGE
jgi:hypothetical protein